MRKFVNKKLEFGIKNRSELKIGTRMKKSRYPSRPVRIYREFFRINKCYVTILDFRIIVINFLMNFS
jgi:hypothetical protein